MTDKRPHIELPVTRVETVEVENPDAPGESMIINKSDFNPDVHTIFKPKAKSKAKAVEIDEDGENDNETEDDSEEESEETPAIEEAEKPKPKGRGRKAS